MHVGVEEAVAEHLREEDLDPARRERRDVDAFLAQLVICEIGMPCMRSITITRCEQNSQCTSGTRAASRPRSCAAAGSRWPPRASGRAPRRGGARIRPPPRAAAAAGRRPTGARRARPRVSSSARSCAIASTPGRSTLTATSRRRAAREVHLRDRGARDRLLSNVANTSVSRTSRRARATRARAGTAAPGPAAAPARRRCPAAAGRAASRGSART